MRIFLACEIPDEIKATILDAQTMLSDDGDKIKWVEKANLRLTMKFIGEQKDSDIEKIKEKLSEIRFAKFSTSISNFGIFSKRGDIRVVWLGLSPAKEINNLHKKIDSSLESLGIQKDGKFKAHITIGRVKHISDKNNFQKRVSEIKEEFKSEHFEIDRFVLKKSVLTPDGPIYSDIANFESINI